MHTQFVLDWTHITWDAVKGIWTWVRTKHTHHVLCAKSCGLRRSKYQAVRPWVQALGSSWDLSLLQETWWFIHSCVCAPSFPFATCAVCVCRSCDKISLVDHCGEVGNGICEGVWFVVWSSVSKIDASMEMQRLDNACSDTSLRHDWGNLV